ncbi:unnamed protein product [Allacma fusca]|uniref:VTT domain-containing protein n=1 Tax=Allacma fusca TaxID=39272 RepID=A0A8J2K608_9HEXA|nr:unnamed protein product [Allacma fusca]
MEGHSRHGLNYLKLYVYNILFAGGRLASCCAPNTVLMQWSKLLQLLTVFLGFTFCLYILYWLSGPDERLHLPRQLEDLKELAILAEDYKVNRPVYTLVLLVSVYIYKQSFAIPGSFLLNLLSGALYGLKGFPLVSFLSAVGATHCYILSKYFGRDTLKTYFPDRIQYFNKLVEQNRHSGLFRFLISLRLFPMTPNWLINMASPIVGVPIIPFFFSVFFGLMPYNYITVQAGEILRSLESASDVISYKTMLVLGVVAVLNFAPVLHKKYKSKFS